MAERGYTLGPGQRARQKLVDVALGRAYADLVIRGGTLINVYAGELIPDADVAIAGERIAVVGDAGRTVGPDTVVVDATGQYLVPGLVDSHYHIESSRLAPRPPRRGHPPPRGHHPGGGHARDLQRPGGRRRSLLP